MMLRMKLRNCAEMFYTSSFWNYWNSERGRWFCGHVSSLGISVPLNFSCSTLWTTTMKSQSVWTPAGTVVQVLIRSLKIQITSSVFRDSFWLCAQEWLLAEFGEPHSVLGIKQGLVAFNPKLSLSHQPSKLYLLVKSTYSIYWWVGDVCYISFAKSFWGLSWWKLS